MRVAIEVKWNMENKITAGRWTVAGGDVRNSKSKAVDSGTKMTRSFPYR